MRSKGIKAGRKPAKEPVCLSKSRRHLSSFGPASAPSLPTMSGTLTHEQLLRAVGHVAEAALPRWGLAGATLKMINHSENTTYLVTPKTSGPDGMRPVILRVHREGYHTVNGIKS